MYDPKFEKGVRQKMEGLEFTPSESVWANIQKAVAGQHRRRGGFFWQLALSAAFVAGLVAVGYFAMRPGKSLTPATRSAASSAATSPSGAATHPNAAAPSGAKTEAAANQPAIASPATPASPIAPASQPATAVAPTRLHDRAVANDPASSATRMLASNRGTTRDRNSVPGHKAAANRHSAGDETPADQFGDANQSQNLKTAAGAAKTAAGGASTAARAPYFYEPALAGQRNTTAIKAASPSAKKNIIALGSLQKTKRPWEAGFSGGGGVSRLNRLTISASTQDQALSANLYNIATSNAAPSKRYVSDIRPDASFTGGIYLQKPLSRRWSVNLGMNLHYYSTRITIGEPVNTYVPATASLIAPTVTPSAQSSTNFIAGDREVFTNHYYFLELPVNVQYQLNKSNLLPLFLEGGFSLSRLMGSDALFYNAHSGVYYKDPSVLEKTQFNVSSALMVGLPFHGIRIMAGPQVQYGLTPLVNNQNQGDQHFLYAGLRVVVIPGRK